MCTHKLVPRCRHCHGTNERNRITEYMVTKENGVPCLARGCTEATPLNGKAYHDGLPILYLSIEPAVCSFCTPRPPQTVSGPPAQQSAAQRGAPLTQTSASATGPQTRGTATKATRATTKSKRPATKPTGPATRSKDTTTKPKDTTTKPTVTAPSRPVDKEACLPCRNLKRECDHVRPMCGPCSQDWTLSGPCTYTIHPVAGGGVTRCDKCITLHLVGCNGRGSKECNNCLAAEAKAQHCLWPDDPAFGKKAKETAQGGPAGATQISSQYAAQGYMQMSDSFASTLPAFSIATVPGSRETQDLYGPDPDSRSISGRTPLPLDRPSAMGSPRNLLTQKRGFASRQGRQQSPQTQSARTTNPVSSQWITYRPGQDNDDDDELWDDASTPPPNVVQADERARQESERNRSVYSQRHSAIALDARGTGLTGGPVSQSPSRTNTGLLSSSVRHAPTQGTPRMGTGGRGGLAAHSQTAAGVEKRARDQISPSEYTDSNPPTPPTYQAPKKSRQESPGATRESVDAETARDERETYRLELARSSALAQGLPLPGVPARYRLDEPKSQGGRDARGGNRGRDNRGRGRDR